MFKPLEKVGLCDGKSMPTICFSCLAIPVVEIGFELVYGIVCK